MVSPLWKEHCGASHWRHTFQTRLCSPPVVHHVTLNLRASFFFPPRALPVQALWHANHMWHKAPWQQPPCWKISISPPQKLLAPSRFSALPCQRRYLRVLSSVTVHHLDRRLTKTVEQHAIPFLAAMADGGGSQWWDWFGCVWHRANSQGSFSLPIEVWLLTVRLCDLLISNMVSAWSKTKVTPRCGPL